jgi:dienelactone hydrolase
MAACCPPGSAPFLKTEYVAQGKVITLPSAGAEVYVAGAPDSPKALVLVPDIYGWNGGRTRALADYFATKGFYTVVAKLLVPALEGGTDGDGFPATAPFSVDFLKTFSWESFKPKLAAIRTHLEAAGHRRSHLLGFCFGGWPSFKALADADLSSFYTCTAVPHPSVQLDKFAFGDDIVTLISAVSSPVLLLPAGNDSAEYDQGGAWCPKGAKSVRFPEMAHGWVVRGDMGDAAVSRDVGRALEEIERFFDEQK